MRNNLIKILNKKKFKKEKHRKPFKIWNKNRFTKQKNLTLYIHRDFKIFKINSPTNNKSKSINKMSIIKMYYNF